METNEPMAASTLIRKLVLELVDAHPGWSASRISREIDATRLDLVDDLFRERRSYILRAWVTDVVGERRREVRDQLRTGEIYAALSADRTGRLVALGDMTGRQAIDVGERYKIAGNRLSTLGDIYIQVGLKAGRRRVKNVYSRDELRDLFQGEDE